MRKLTRKNLDELAKVMPVISENELKEFIGGDKVVITINRTDYGNNSTLGYFSAVAYDENGAFIANITGVTLERNYDQSLENVPDSGVAIAPGTYEVVNGTYHGNSEYYQISGIDGRNGIFFHAGNESDDTTGCILLGSSSNTTNGEHTIAGSASTVQFFNNFLKQFGDEGITLHIHNSSLVSTKKK